MLRSMYSGISGMKVNQTKLDVIGNNIANVGTTGFKSSKARFQDMLSQNVKDAMAPSTNQGGVNSKQVGLGVQLASIDTVMTQGMLQPTGRSLDLAIDGDGFFMVSKGPAVYGDNTLEVSHRVGSHNITSESLSSSGSSVMYSRDGSFILDESGNLLTSDGYRVMGYGLTNDNNGVEATGQKPGIVSNSGLDFRFGPGSQLNGYKVVLGQVGPGTVTSAELDKSNKTLIVDGDFSEGTTLTAAQVESAVNKGLSSGGVSQRINVSGNVAPLGILGTARTSAGSDASAPDSVSFLGSTFKFSDGSDLNNITFKITNTNAASTSADLVKNSATGKDEVLIKGNFIDGLVSLDDLKAKINTALKTPATTFDTGYKAATAKTGTIISATGSISGFSDFNKTIGTDGVAPTGSPLTGGTAPTSLSIAGMTISFPTTDELNNNQIKFISDSTAAGVSAAYTATQAGPPIVPGQIVVTGNFANGINTADVATALNGMTPPLTNFTGNFTVTAQNLKAMPLQADTINGGIDSNAPAAQTAFGLNFAFGKGAELNGYNVVMGNMAASTKPSVDIDTTNKTIIVNGDFVNSGAIDSSIINIKLNKALQEKGISQGITVSGTPTVFSGTESAVASGGTPVESISADGSINFVDGTKEVKAYDGSLKTLKIPDKVKIPGTDQELRVKSYTIDKTGIVNAILEDGSVAAVGQLAMASFKNPEGLSKLGGNLYTQSANSGEPSIKSGIGTLGDDNSKGFGTSVQGMLEMSNVDLAEQFTDMIVTNRAFQASGKMITTGDEVLQDIINLKR